MSPSLAGEVEQVCAALRERVGATALRDGIEKVGRSVREPLVVAVAGRLKAGKSTLVNALLGRRVAAVAVGECTKVVTWFRYGPSERIQVTARDHTRWTVPFTDDGCMPKELGAPHTEIERVDVWLSNRLLERLTIVDTPGLDSLTEGVSAATEDLLVLDEGSRAAVAGADALVFLIPKLAAADHERLRTFRRLFDGTALSPVNVVGVLSKADRVGDPGSDPAVRARELVARYAMTLRDVAATVVPVVGLLAETAETDRFTERDAADLRAIAALPTDVRVRLLTTADRFVTMPIEGISPERRMRLLEQLDMYGVGSVLSAIDDGRGSTREIVDLVRGLSGIAELRLVVDAHLGRRADALKAYAALGELERLSYLADRDGDPAFGQSMRSRIEAVRLDPAMHELAEFDAYRSWWSGAAVLPDDRAQELRALVLESDVAARLGLAGTASGEDCRRRALELATTWLAFQNDPRSTPSQVRVAAVARDSFTLMWEASTP